MDYDIDIIYFFKILNKWKNKILILVIIGIVAGIIKANFIPTEYSSQATGLLSPKASDLSYMTLNRMLPDLRLEYLPAQAVISMIASSRMRDGIDKRFNLKNNSKFKLINITSYSLADVIIVVGVRGTDPELTKSIADFCITNIDNINNDIKISSEKPVLRLMDPASTGKPITNNLVKGMIAGGFFACIFSIIAAFFLEYVGMAYKYQQNRRIS